MVTINGYGRCLKLTSRELTELEQYFWSMYCNGVDSPTNNAYRKVYDALVELESVMYPKKEKS